MHTPAIALPLQGGDVDAELCHNTRHGCCQATRLAGVQKEGDFHFFKFPILCQPFSDMSSILRVWTEGTAAARCAIDNVGNHNSGG